MRKRYELHGILTAMEVISLDGDRLVACPCGYGFLASEDVKPDPQDEAAMRFHYTHCPQAKQESSMNDLTSYEAEAVAEVAHHRRGLERAIRKTIDNGLHVTGEIRIEKDPRAPQGVESTLVDVCIEVKKPIELPE